MRVHSIVLTIGLLMTGLAAGQQTPAGALDPNGQKLDQVLMSWERSMSGVDTLWAEVTRTENNKVFKTQTVYKGAAKFMKPNLALVHVELEGKRELYERYLCTGTHLYVFFPERKQIRVRPLPKPAAGQGVDDNLMNFFFNMKAADSKRRYEMGLAFEDQHYYYIEVLPRLPQDKAEFKKARIVLTKDRFLPAQFWFIENNDNEVTWGIPRLDVNSKGVVRQDFAPPTNLPGWTKVSDPPPPTSPASRSELPPRVIRQGQGQ